MGKHEYTELLYEPENNSPFVQYMSRRLWM